MSIPYLPLYVADYEADTAHLSVAEDGAYMRLLRLQWRTPGCTLPNDHAWIQRRVRASDSEWSELFEPLLSEFFTVNRGRIYQGRLRKEYERINATSAKRSSAGKKGGRPRKPLKTNETGISPAKANEKHLEPELDIKREAKASPKKATRLPDDWVLSKELGNWALSEGLPEARIRIEAERFRDYWLGVGGAKGRKADWPATWRNWVRKAIDDLPKQTPNGGGNDRAGRMERAIQAIAKGRGTPQPGMAGGKGGDPSKAILADRGDREGICPEPCDVVRLPLRFAMGGAGLGDQRTPENERPTQADHWGDPGAGGIADLQARAKA